MLSHRSILFAALTSAAVAALPARSEQASQRSMPGPSPRRDATSLRSRL